MNLEDKIINFSLQFRIGKVPLDIVMTLPLQNGSLMKILRLCFN